MAAPRGKAWQARVRGPGKYHRYTFPTQAAAEAWEQTAREAVRKGEPIVPPTVISQSATDPTLSAFFEEYAPIIWADNNWDNVMRNQRAAVKLLGASTPLRMIDQPALTGAVEKMRKASLSPSTINTRLSHIVKLLRYAESKGIEVPPIDTPWVKKVKNARKRFLTENEEEAILKVMEHMGMEDDARIIETLIDTGCRPSELIWGDSIGDPIRWDEVSKLAGGSAPDVPDPDTGEAVAVITIARTKTGDFRVLPLTDRARKNFLVSHQRGDKRPFGDVNAGELSQRFRMVCDTIGLNDVVLYTCRHTCASRLVQRGAELYRVKTWMGHEDIKTTLGYAKLVPRDIFGIGKLL